MPPAGDITRLWEQLAWLFILPIPIASISWTVTHEEIFREPRDYCERRTRTCRTLLARKLFYIPTCEYCFSHYVTLLFLFLTGYHLLLADWRGAVIAFFAVTAIANVYLSLYGRLRVDIKSERVQIAEVEKRISDGPLAEMDEGERPRPVETARPGRGRAAL